MFGVAVVKYQWAAEVSATLQLARFCQSLCVHWAGRFFALWKKYNHHIISFILLLPSPCTFWEVKRSKPHHLSWGCPPLFYHPTNFIFINDDFPYVSLHSFGKSSDFVEHQWILFQISVQIEFNKGLVMNRFWVQFLCPGLKKETKWIIFLQICIP